MQALSIFTCSCLAAGILSAQTVSLTVNTDTVLHSIDPRIYGQSLDPSHSAHGGIWGEVVSNRSFENSLTQGAWKVNGGVLEAAAGNGDSRFRFGAETSSDHELSLDAMRPSGNGILTVGELSDHGTGFVLSLGGAGVPIENGRWYNVRVKIEGMRRQAWLDGKPLIDLAGTEGLVSGQAFVGVHGGAASFAHLRVKGAGGTPLFAAVPTAARHWYSTGGGEASLDTNLPFNGRQSLRISRDDDSGIEQPGYAVRAGDALRGSLWLSGTGPGLVVRLLEGDKILAQQTIPAPTADWTEFPLLLTPLAASGNATLRIQAPPHSDVRLDQVSLMPDSFRANGGFRPDLTQAITALHPPVIRWQAGRWKDAIGPQSKRVGDNASFGIDEFLAFARRVGAEPMIVVSVDRAEYIQDAFDLAAYINDPADSVWGKIRVQNGHPAPYHVKYWEIGDRISNPPAPDCHQVFSQLVPVMKKTDPAIRIIAGCSRQPIGADLAEFLDVPHSAYAAQSKSPKLFVSGWSAQTGLEAGMILNALERDPAVAIAAPANLLRHKTSDSSNSALINFDQNSWVPSAPYVVMKLYRDHFAPDLLEIAGHPGGLNATATRSADGDKIYLKLVNPTGQEVPVQVALRGDFPLLAASMQLVVADSPAPVQAVESNIERTGMTVRFRLPRGSVAVVTFSR